MAEALVDLSEVAEADYPDKTCTIDELVTKPALVEKALAGEKVEQRRNGLYAYPGETFDLDGVTFEVVDVWKEPLRALDDEAAEREGFPDLDTYKAEILDLHGEGSWWDGDHPVWVHRFRRRS